MGIETNGFDSDRHMRGRNRKTLSEKGGHAMVIDGLWGLSFGNGVLSDEDELYFTAGPEDETHGIYGEIEASE